MSRPPLPPFTRETAIQKVRLAEDSWNTRDPAKVALAYSIDTKWRNRAEFANGRPEIIAFLARKWARELDYRLIKELWAFDGNRIAVRFAYEWHDDSFNWLASAWTLLWSCRISCCCTAWCRTLSCPMLRACSCRRRGAFRSNGNST